MKFTVQDFDVNNLDPDRTTKMYINEEEYKMLNDTFPNLKHIEMRDILYVIRIYDVALRSLADLLQMCTHNQLAQKPEDFYMDALHVGKMDVKITDNMAEDNAVMEIQVIKGEA